MGFILPSEQAIIDAIRHIEHRRTDLAIAVLDRARTNIIETESPKIVVTGESQQAWKRYREPLASYEKHAGKRDINWAAAQRDADTINRELMGEG